MAKRTISYALLAVLSLGCLSVSFEPKGSRGIACLEPSAEANVLPLSSGLFGEIQDEALKKSTLDYYLFLSKVEMQALAGRQAIRMAYGISDGGNSMFPSVRNFDLGANTFAGGHLWGQIGSPGLGGFTVGKTPPSFNFSSVRSGRDAVTEAKSSPVGGMAFPAGVSPGHKIGTF